MSISKAKPLHLLGILLFVTLGMVAVALPWQSSVDTAGATQLSAVLLIFSCAIFFHTAIKTGSVFNGYTLVLGTFLVTYPLSALTHLAGERTVSQGFYHMAMLDPYTQAHHVYLSLALVFLGQLGLWWGLSPTRSASHSARPFAIPSTLLYFFSVTFTILGVFGTYMLSRESGGLLTHLVTVERGRIIGDGTARFAFLSAWLSWGITFGLTAFLGSRTGRARPKTSFVLALIGSSCMFLNMYWTGGRAENVLIVIPLLLVIRRLHERVLWPSLCVLAAGAGLLMALQTFERTKLNTNEATSQAIGVLDWQMGRYPTLGLIFDMVEVDGYALGSTLLQGPAMTANAPSTLLGIPFKLPEPLPITGLVGRYLFSNPDLNGVVPGTMAELYYNFGTLGVILGFYAIGRLARYCIRLSQSRDKVGVLLLAAYAIVVVCTWTIPMTATLGLYFLATRGLPVLLFWAIESLAQQHRSVATYRLRRLMGPPRGVTLGS